MAVRALLVGSSVGLATPAFVLAAVFQAWWRVAPKTTLGRASKFLIGTVIGGGSVTLVFDYVGPFLRDHSELVLPFALANAVTSSFWYLACESVLGLEMMMGAVMTSAHMAKNGGASKVIEAASLATGGNISNLLRRLPFAGTIVGALTACTAPLLWSGMFDLCWDESLKELVLGEEFTKHASNGGSDRNSRTNWLLDTYANFTLPVALPVGAFAGATMHLVLRDYAMGTPGTPWKTKTLPPLLGVLLASTLYFSLFRTEIDDWWWEERVDPTTGSTYSYNHKSQETRSDHGRLATIASLKRGFLRSVHAIRHKMQAIRRNMSLSGAGGDKGKAGRPPRLNESNTSNGSMVLGSSNSKAYPFPVRSLEGADATLRAVEERAILFELIDRLLRLKALDQELAKPASERPIIDDAKEKRDALLEEAKEGKLCHDLSVVLRAVEVGVAAMEDSDRSRGAGRMKDVRVSLESQIMEDTYKEFWLRFLEVPESTNEYRMASLYHNLPLVGREMKQRLGYSPDAATIDSEYRSLRANNFLGSTFFRTSVLAITGALLVAFAQR